MPQMAVEIERKFLVTSEQWREATPVLYCQGYLNSETNRTIRVRIGGDRAFLTIKGPTIGASRDEFEYEIPVDDATKIMEMAEKPLIKKYRRVIPFEGMDWEVDEFLDENSGLVIAEVELQSESQPIVLPPWVGEEVTYDRRYFNSYLVKHPFKTWENNRNS